MLAAVEGFPGRDYFGSLVLEGVGLDCRSGGSSKITPGPHREYSGKDVYLARH